MLPWSYICQKYEFYMEPVNIQHKTTNQTDTYSQYNLQSVSFDAQARTKMKYVVLFKI